MLKYTLGSGKIIVGDASGVSQAVAMSGDVTIGNTGVTAIGASKVTNAMLAGSIAASKLIGTDITTVGTITAGTWTGTTIAIANGGTGQTTASAAFDALAPSQTGNNGKYLTTNGTTTSWATVTAGVSGSGTSGKLTKWTGTTSIGDSVWAEDANGAMSATLSGGTAATLILSNGTAAASILQLKDNTTTKWDFKDDGYLVHTTTGVSTADKISHDIVANQSGTTGIFYTDGSGGNWAMRASQYNSGNSTNSGSGHGGGVFIGANGNHQVSVSGITFGGVGTSPRSFGVYGFCSSAGTTPTTYVGGFFHISTSANYHATIPSGYKAALIGSNGLTTDDIFQCYDNTTLTLKVTDNGNKVLSGAALSTSATDGFVYVPTCAGVPSGTPTAYTGTVAMVYDSTNNDFYVYNSAWKKVTLA